MTETIFEKELNIRDFFFDLKQPHNVVTDRTIWGIQSKKKLKARIIG
jgi:hypothetical protein